MPPLEPAQSGPVFRITLGAGVWHVRRDDVFFGDYRTRDDAVGAAQAAARLHPNARVETTYPPPDPKIAPVI